MKKRILASTMASVMALSAVGTSLISSAAVADYKQETITKAELKAFLADSEIKGLADGDIDNYGSISGENFMTAYQYAQSVVDDSDTNDDDCTAAFQMVKAAKDQLHTYDAKALLALVEECRPDYNTENLLSPNSDSDDAIWTDGTWGDFADAFVDADGYTSYTGDIRITTDAYEALKEAHGKLKKLTVKTKREIDSARQAYEKALDLEFKYQPWQRGSIKGADSAYNKDVSWGAIYAHVLSGNDSVMEQYNKFAGVKGLTKTSNPDIVAAVNAMDLCAKILNGFTPITMEAGNQRKVTTLIAQYQGRLVYEYASDKAAAVYESFVDVADEPLVKANGVWNDASSGAAKEDIWDVTESKQADCKALDIVTQEGVTKILYAEMGVKSSDANIYYVVDTRKENVLLNGEQPIVEIDPGVYFSTSAPSVDTAKFKVVNVKKGREIVISDLIPVGAADVAASTANEDPAVKSAYEAWEAKDADVRTAEDEVAEAIADLYDEGDAEADPVVPASGSLKTDLAAVEAEIAKIAAMQSEATGKTTLLTKITDLDTALKALQKGVEDTIDETKQSTFKSDNKKLAAVIATDATADSLQKAVKDAVDAVTAQAKTDSVVFTAAAAQPPITTTTTALAGKETALATAQSAADAAWDAYETVFNTAAGAAASDSNYKKNNYFDVPGEMTKAFNKGLCTGDYTALDFDVTTPYASSAVDGNSCSATTVSLYDALVMIDVFNDSVANKAGDWVDIAGLDNLNEIVDPDSEKAPSSPAWKLLYNYLKYALEDTFDASAKDSYTKAQVEKLLSDSYQLVSDTIETSMFATSNDKLVDARTLAAEWVKIANNNRRTYKDNVSRYDLSDGHPYDSTEIYGELNKAYKQLKDEKDGFAYSYGDIVIKMSDAAKLLDGDTLSGSAKDSVKKALTYAAVAMTKVTVLVDKNEDDFEESAPFNEDGSLNVYNRVLTVEKVKIKTPDGTVEIEGGKKDGDNKTHYNLKTAVEALDKAVEDATKVPEKDPLDIDGDGTVALKDVTEMLKLYSNGKCDVAKHDFNKNEKIDLGDVTEMLKQYSNK